MNIRLRSRLDTKIALFKASEFPQCGYWEADKVRICCLSSITPCPGDESNNLRKLSFSASLNVSIRTDELINFVRCVRKIRKVSGWGVKIPIELFTQWEMIFLALKKGYSVEIDLHSQPSKRLKCYDGSWSHRIDESSLTTERAPERVSYPHLFQSQFWHLCYNR